MNFRQLEAEDARSHGPAGEPLDLLRIESRFLPIRFRRNLRARHYTIYIRPDRSLAVTIPRGGSLKGAAEFVRSRSRWIERTLEKMDQREPVSRHWIAGTVIFFRGERVILQVEQTASGRMARLGESLVPVPPERDDLRPFIEKFFIQVANRELPERVIELANAHRMPVRKVAIRDQRTRWGSCSIRGAIALNWRLVQLPIQVRDYIIIHELMHLREMNHSERFWEQVAQACPNYLEAERWIKKHASLIGF